MRRKVRRAVEIGPELDAQLDMLCKQLDRTGTWDTFWQAFLDVLPESIQPEIAHSEMTVRF